MSRFNVRRHIFESNQITTKILNSRSFNETQQYLTAPSNICSRTLRKILQAFAVASIVMIDHRTICDGTHYHDYDKLAWKLLKTKHYSRLKEVRSWMWCSKSWFQRIKCFSLTAEDWWTPPSLASWQLKTICVKSTTSNSNPRTALSWGKHAKKLSSR